MQPFSLLLLRQTQYYSKQQTQYKNSTQGKNIQLAVYFFLIFQHAIQIDCMSCQSSVMRFQQQIEEFQYNHQNMTIKTWFSLLILANIIFVLWAKQQQNSREQITIYKTQQKIGASSYSIVNTKNYDLSQISQQLQGGTFIFDQKQLNNLLGDNKLSCSQKGQFIKNIISIYKKKALQNAQQIKNLKNKASTVGQSRSIDNHNELQITNKTLLAINGSIKQRVTLANYYIGQLQKIGTKKVKQAKSKEQLAVQKLQAQTAKLDKVIYDTVVIKTQVQKKINENKLKLSSVQNIPEIDYQEEYRKYAQLSFSSTLKVKEKEEQINKYNSQISTLSSSSLPIDIQINQNKKKLQQLKSASSSQNLIQLNKSLQLIADNMANKVNELSKSCRR